MILADTPSKYLIIYHAHCNDGFGAAWAVWDKLVKTHVAAPVNVFLHEASYGSEVPWDRIDNKTVVFIVDFSYSPELIVDIANQALQVFWIDHHKTALDAWFGSNYYGGKPLNLHTYLSVIRSGAMLAWTFVNDKLPEAAPKLIQYIEDRDLWKFEFPDTEKFHLNLNTQPKDMAHWNKLAEYLEEPHLLAQFVEGGAAIQRYYHKTMEGIIATNKVYCYIDGLCGLAVNCPAAFASDIGHKLASESGTFGLTWEEQNGAIEKCSLRSNGEFDVATIAKSFGGGGHRNAAGFTLDLTSDDTKGRLRFESI